MQRIRPHTKRLSRIEQATQRRPSRTQEISRLYLPYSGPDFHPQMQINPAHPSLGTNYDQALGVIKDSINATNPLASLNL